VRFLTVVEFKLRLDNRHACIRSSRKEATFGWEDKARPLGGCQRYRIPELVAKLLQAKSKGLLLGVLYRFPHGLCPCSNQYQTGTQLLHRPSVTKETRSSISFQKPTWGIRANHEEDTSQKIKATWLGHACFLLELPPRLNSVDRGVRILFDPVFSDRCSPSQRVGPKRYTRESLSYIASQ
jgi:hypothetical protein